MYEYYCKNCNNIVGKWDNKDKYYNVIDHCNYINSKNIAFINFLDCGKCNKFIGIACYYVCKNCFGENKIYGKENLFNWFLKYKKTVNNKHRYSLPCKRCNKYDYRFQYWLFEELTFYK